MSLPLPQGKAVPVIRTDFTSPDGWERLMQALLTPVGMLGPSDSTDDYDRAVHYVEEVDLDSYLGVQPGDVLAVAPLGHRLGYGHVYLADAVTFASDDLPLLGVDIDPEGERVEPFRVPALHVSGVEVNVELGNLWFSEYQGFEWEVRDLVVAGPGTVVWEAFEQLDRA